MVSLELGFNEHTRQPHISGKFSGSGVDVDVMRCLYTWLKNGDTLEMTGVGGSATETFFKLCLVKVPDPIAVSAPDKEYADLSDEQLKELAEILCRPNANVRSQEVIRQGDESIVVRGEYGSIKRRGRYNEIKIQFHKSGGFLFNVMDSEVIGIELTQIFPFVRRCMEMGLKY